jgi:translation elongation factor EF-4
MQLFPPHEATVSDLADWGHDRVQVLRLLCHFVNSCVTSFNEVKSASSGYASIVYEPLEMRPADVTRLDVFVAEERVTAFSRVIPEYRAREESEEVVEKLEKILPAEMFRVKIQAYVRGRIVASRSIAPMKKDVTGYMYGGDITRKDETSREAKAREGKNGTQKEKCTFHTTPSFK